MDAAKIEALKTQAVIDGLIAQRNQAMDRIVTLNAELQAAQAVNASLLQQLQDAEKQIAELRNDAKAEHEFARGEDS